MVAIKREALEREVQSLKAELARMKQGAINRNFVQVSKEYIDEMTDLSQRAPSAHKLLWRLIKEMDKTNTLMVSQESLVVLTGLSVPTIKRAIALLKKENWLEVLKMGTANIYRVNSDLVWQSRADGKWAAFHGKLLIRLEEQDEEVKKNPIRRTKHIPFVEADDDVMVLQGKEPPPDQPQLDFHKEA